MMQPPEPTAELRLAPTQRTQLRRALAQLHVAGLDVSFDLARSRFLRFGSRLLVVGFDRRLFGRGADLGHLRGQRSLVAVIGQAHPVDPTTFEAYRMAVLDLRDDAEPRLEVRRLDGSLAHVGAAAFDGHRLSITVPVTTARLPVRATITGSVTADGTIKLTGAAVSIRTNPRRPHADAPR